MGSEQQLTVGQFTNELVATTEILIQHGMLRAVIAVEEDSIDLDDSEMAIELTLSNGQRFRLEIAEVE